MTEVMTKENINIYDIISDFKDHLITEKKSKHTIKQYTNIIKNLFIYINKDHTEICEKDLIIYKKYLVMEKDYSKNSIYLSVKAIQCFFKFLNRNDAESLTTPKRPKQMPKYLTENETKRLLEAALNDPRDYAILVLFSYSGLRLSELCNLKIDDLDFSEKVLHVVSGKGDKDRIVIINDKTTDALKNYLQFRKEYGKHLFISRKKTPISTVHVERIVKKYAMKAEINKNVTPHVLRHTFATTLMRNGADIRFIQQILGHASVATTQIYTHINEDFLKSMYDKYKPNY